MQKPIVQMLSHVLADTYLMMLKAQNYHWNVTGSHFIALHGFFEEITRELFEVVDEVAERIRALGAPAPGSLEAFLRLSSLEEASDELVDARQMLEECLSDQEGYLTLLYRVMEMASEAEDEATVDMILGRIRAHEKLSWKLESLLGKD